MKEHTFERPIGTFAPVAQPDFEDERTVLSARPVVPLETINAKARHRRYWLLCGAFAIAMVLGAASALVASYLKLRNVPTLTSEISEPDETTAPVVVAESVAGDVPVVEITEDSTIPVTPVTEQKEPAVKRRTLVKRSPDLIEPRSAREMSEEDELHRIRDAVLFDAWEEKRARRAARRERRNNRDNDRDLSNLDEIFEGPRRP